jgi:hypothetical protein
LPAAIAAAVCEVSKNIGTLLLRGMKLTCFLGMRIQRKDPPRLSQWQHEHTQAFDRPVNVSIYGW